MPKWKSKRSGGVPVTKVVHALLTRGNGARDHGEWSNAAEAYRAALALDGSLAHIWVQLGHVLAEGRRWEEAEDAYTRAISAGGDAGEAGLHLGHLFKRAGEQVRSAANYRDAAVHGNADALDELTRSVRRLVPTSPQAIRAALVAPPPSAEDPIAALRRLLALAPAEAERLRPLIAAFDLNPPVTGHHVVSYDISDLISHWRHHRLPTGIQRFQMEVLTRALQDASLTSRICCFVAGNDDLAEVPAELFVTLADLARSGSDTSDPAWRQAVTRLFLHVATAGPYQFTPGECLVNLGTSWWIYNYFLLIRNARADHGIRFVATVFDLIPIYASEHCVRGIAEDYASWLVGAFQHTDHFLCISQATANDLARTARQLGLGPQDDHIEVVALDADFRTPQTDVVAADLQRFQISARNYALFVSTIESRKNHILALEVWARLLEKHGTAVLPRLVFVGRNGWLNDQVFGKLAENPRLRSLVTIIERASDADLAMLYRNCLFTVYPSLYEGWGLPVTESLCYGRLPVTADNSSLPEAGGRFAAFFESNNISAFEEVAERAIFDTAWREERERLIVEEYAPRSWREIADAVIASARRELERETPRIVEAVAESGHYYPVSRYRGVRIWPGLAGGEMFRVGYGWHWPDEQGSRTKPGGGALRLRLPAGGGRWRLLVRLRGLESEDCPYRLAIDEATVEGTIERGAVRWSRPITFEASADAVVLVHLEGFVEEVAQILEGGAQQQRSASVSAVGFFLHREEDANGRLALLRASATGDLEDISAYAERLSR